MRLYIVLIGSNLQTVSIPLDTLMLAICLIVIALCIRKEVVK